MSQSQSGKTDITKSSLEFQVRILDPNKWMRVAAQSQLEAEKIARKDGHRVFPIIIVKVQVSIESGVIWNGMLVPNSSGAKTMLIYDESQIIHYEGPAIGDVLFKMDNKVKAYFYACIVGKELEIYELAPTQTW